MYGQFLYFIIVILIYSTYQPSGKTNFSFVEAFIYFLLMNIAFIFSTRIYFKKFEKQIDKDHFHFYEEKFNKAVTRHIIFSIILFTATIYLLNLTDFIEKFYIFSKIPSFSALFCIALFIAYLSIIYKCAHGLYQKIYNNYLPPIKYIISNISFSMPVVLPWIILSLIADVLNILPFGPLKRFISSTYGEIFYFTFFLFVTAVIGPVIIKKLWNCKPLENGYERYRIEKVCGLAGLKYADILYWPLFGGKMITAGVMGLVKKFRYILITHSLLRLLNPQELDAVIAHEIGHVKKKHLIYYLMFFFGYFILSYTLSNIFLYIFIYYKFSIDIIANANVNAFSFTPILFNTLFFISFIVYFRFLFGFFMRNFEREADAYVFKLFDSAGPLIASLEKIAFSSGLAPEKPNWHHFSISERISYLRQCEENKEKITSHERKVKKSIIIYLLALAITCGVLLNLSFGKTGRNLNNILIEKILLKEIETHGDDPNLYQMLGDFYQSSQKYKQALLAYEKSIYYRPKNALALNNMAWLLATCSDIEVKNPKLALETAKKASSIETSPYILDTLAESLYINRFYEEAVKTELKALELEKNDKAYYEKQLKKFTKEMNRTSRSGN